MKAKKEAKRAPKKGKATLKVQAEGPRKAPFKIG